MVATDEKTMKVLSRASYPGGLMDSVLGILDSKIQYQEFKINQAVKSYVDLHPMNFQSIADQKRFQPILENNSRVLENIDKSSLVIKLIFIIRKRLTHSNAKLILTLISEKKFENFTAQGLIDLLEKPWMNKSEIA